MYICTYYYQIYVYICVYIYKWSYVIHDTQSTLGHMMYGYKLLLLRPLSPSSLCWYCTHYVYLAFVRFEHSACCESLMIAHITLPA